MNFESFKTQLADEFPKAVQKAIDGQSPCGRYVQSLLEICSRHHKDWGFDYPSAAWDDAVPKSDRLTLFAWSEAGLVVDTWRMRVSVKAFSISHDGVHIEIFSEGRKPLPFTETGYRSYFLPLTTFRDEKTPADFVREQFPRDVQMQLPL